MKTLEESGEQVTFIIIVTVAACGTIILLFIVVLMAYLCRKKEKQMKALRSDGQQKAPSEGTFFNFFLFCLLLLTHFSMVVVY